MLNRNEWKTLPSHFFALLSNASADKVSDTTKAQ